ncbi:MAG: hypothetical protein U1G05_16265 [Kiritimatiellia bacterium]
MNEGGSVESREVIRGGEIRIVRQFPLLERPMRLTAVVSQYHSRYWISTPTAEA